jgi:hypothetical protein
MLVYRILELLEDNEEDMVEKLDKVSSDLYKHVNGKWPDEVVKEGEETMWLPQGTRNKSYKDNPCMY